MRKVSLLSLAAALCLAAVSIAAGDQMDDKPMEGKITKLDKAARTLTVKDAAGKESSLCWNDATKIEGGDLKEGATVHYKATERKGKWWATWVHVGPMPRM
jgi:hypothetical protein